MEVNFVYERIECKNSLSFDAVSLLAFPKFCADPKLATPGVYKLCTF